MKLPKIGCFTSSGIISAAIMVLFVVGIGFAQGGELFSPGELNAQASGVVYGGVRSHAELKGDCGACHTAIWQKDHMIDRCLGCHTEVDLSTNNFHGIMKAQGKLLGCYGCHTEHNGANASLINFDTTNFPHDSLRFSLNKHKIQLNGNDFTCSDCHGVKIQAMDIKRCTDCHTTIDLVFMNQHSADFGPNCLDCHDGVDRFGESFDHQLTGYPLAGKHGTLICSSCHIGARSATDFAKTSQDCFACHAAQDNHSGSFGQNCAACHAPTGWKPAQFEHSATNFPLIGEHLKVECAECHQNNTYKGTPQDCYSCHSLDDDHNGEFGRDCAGCHTPEDWENAQFDHSKSAFPLTGKHINTACAECHKNGQYKGTSNACADCHIDPAIHQGLFTNLCETCHSTSGWLPANYNLSHTFPLDHPNVTSCRDCHTTTLSEYTCYTCHEKTEMASKHTEEGIRDIQDCVKCHDRGQKEDHD